MDRKTASGFLLIIFLVFVGFGDSFLPKPLSSASLSTRTTLNKWIIGLFPSWQPKTNPNQRTQKALEETEKGSKSR
ncbi:hypothetical protein F7734_47475 [Scytonema sp. UIC 10036]|uniref:hypothetical protein n=1 Tax=Scytonema sp. UIC 10036 TaxID=2304196 RepID=UPI0012DA0279|nr:hypothetical protein [Scytonema sp. UIC 10036]MUG99525.1 hypothetical protein [Scytonema sp. UIC 10036]